jgi:hypothetical protein
MSRAKDFLKVTTSMTSIIADRDFLVTGDESYPIIGELLTPLACSAIFKKMEVAGLNRYWDCLPKAKIVLDHLGQGELKVGSMYVWSGDMLSNYGYEFRPPFEFHAWVAIGEDIVDMALPGVIEKGLSTRDEIGPALVGRSPVILAGPPLPWMTYKPHHSSPSLSTMYSF